MDVRGPSVRLNLPPELGKISPWVNVRRLKFFEQRDAEFTDLEAPVRPVRGGDGALRYEIHRIWRHRPHGKLPAKEYLVQWKGYDTSQMTWVARAPLLADVPRLLHVYEACPPCTDRRVLMRHFVIRFAGFVKSVRSNRVVREERLLGIFSVYVACVHVLHVLVYSYH